jgi:hypothetical protein
VVIGFSPVEERYSAIRAKDVIGQNFFNEIVPAEKVWELREGFLAFMESGESIKRMTSIFSSEQGEVKIQMVLPGSPGEKKADTNVWLWFGLCQQMSVK